jgi:hypothetical protein
MHDDLVAGGEAGQDVGYAVVPMTDPDWESPLPIFFASK